MNHPASQQPEPMLYYPGQDVHEKTGQSQQHQQQPYEPYAAHYGNVDGPAANPGPTMITVTRAVALSALAVVLFLFLAVVGCGAGLGVSQRELRQARADLEAVRASISAAAGVVSTAIATPTTTTSAKPTATADVQCPRVNGTVYTASTGGKRFRRMCGIDYGGEGEAIDIGNVQTRNLDACLDACAARGDCTGAGWGVIDDNSVQKCWMKKNLTRFHSAPGWGFGVLVK